MEDKIGKMDEVNILRVPYVPIVSAHMDHTFILKLKGCDSGQQLVRFVSFFKSTLREKPRRQCKTSE